MQTPKRATASTLLALLLGFGLMQMGNTLQGTLLSVRGGIEGFSPAQIGAVGAGFWVGIVIGSLRCGKLIQSVGHIRTFLALGAMLITQGAGAALGPVVGGVAMSAFHQHGLGYTLIATQILMAVFGVYRLTRRAAPPEMHKGVFVVEPSVPVGTTLESAHSRADHPKNVTVRTEK